MRFLKNFCRDPFIKQTAYSPNKSEWAACGLVSLWTALTLLGQNCIDPQELIDFSDDPHIAENGAIEKQLSQIAREFGCRLEKFKFRNDFEKAWSYLRKQSCQSLPVILHLGRPLPNTSGHASVVYGTNGTHTHLMEPDDTKNGFVKLSKSDFKKYWLRSNEYEVFTGKLVIPVSRLATDLFKRRILSLKQR